MCVVLKKALSKDFPGAIFSRLPTVEAFCSTMRIEYLTQFSTVSVFAAEIFLCEISKGR